MSTSPVRTFLNESPGLYQSNEDPFIYQSGTWDVATWNPSFCDDALTFSSSEIKFIVWAYSGGRVRFRLEYSFFNKKIQEQVRKAGLESYLVESFTTDDSVDQLQKVYQVITQHYGITDPDRVIERLAKWGSYHFPELCFQSGNWDLEEDPKWPKQKEMVFACHDLKFIVSGDVDGGVSFRVENTHYDFKGTLRKRLVEAGIDPEKLPVGYSFSVFSAETPEELQKVYQMLCKHYPLMEQDELIEGLAHYGNWKEEKARRSIPLEHMQQRV